MYIVIIVYLYHVRGINLYRKSNKMGLVAVNKVSELTIEEQVVIMKLKPAYKNVDSKVLAAMLEKKAKKASKKNKTSLKRFAKREEVQMHADNHTTKINAMSGVEFENYMDEQSAEARNNQAPSSLR